MKCENTGYFLLEAAIGISIIGLISGFFITKYIVANKAVRIQKTKANIEFAVSSLAAYVAVNGRLPRPAPDSNGFESENCKVAVGKLPYNTLGISIKNATDGDAHILTYIVEPQLTTCSSIYGATGVVGIMDNRDDYFCKYIPEPNLIIKGQDNLAVGDIVAFVIDTKNIKYVNTDKNVIVSPSANTFWIRRNVFLIHYLKLSPSAKVIDIMSPAVNESDFDDSLLPQNVRNDDIF